VPGAGVLSRWAVAAVLVLSACSAAPGTAPAAPPDLAFSVSQYRADENTPRANLRVVNADPDHAVEVTTIGLDWAGYGPEFGEPHESTVPPGQTLDLTMTFPEPDCDAEDAGPATAVVTVAGQRVTGELEPAGQGFLESLWRRSCNRAAVEEVAGVRLGERWRQRGRGEAASYDGSIVLERREAGPPLTVTNLEGSILFRLDADPPFRLGPGRPRLVVPVRLTPFRCDAHARGETTQAFLFRLDVEVGDGPSRRITITTEDADWRMAAMDYLDEACG
jgi:hypothetical protein